MAGQTGLRSMETDKNIWNVNLPQDETDLQVDTRWLRNNLPPVHMSARPVGEKREEAATSPQALMGVPAGTIRGRSVGVLKSKLRSSPEIMLKGRPDTASMIGATVQSLKNFLTKPFPTCPLW